MGLWAALVVLSERAGRELPPPPPGTMLGGLLRYLREAEPKRFQPMNVNFGILPDDESRVRKADRKAHRIARGRDCVVALRDWAAEHGLELRAPPLAAQDPLSEMSGVTEAAAAGGGAPVPAAAFPRPPAAPAPRA
jgi:hypothetical protein